MLHIAVCDDEPSQLLMLEKLTGVWAEKREVEIKVSLSRNADQFLFGWEEKKDIDILLLDIEMPGMNGLALARRLREIGENLQIIFVTGLEDYMLEGYDVDAVSYLLKPVNEEKLFFCLDRAWQRLDKPEAVILLDTVEGLIRIRIKDISYLESMAHETMVCCKGNLRDIRCKTGISRLEKMLESQSDGFFRIHRSYLVHMAHIEKITRKEVFMEHDVCLPIARGKWEELNNAWLRYYRKRGMELS